MISFSINYFCKLYSLNFINSIKFPPFFLFQYIFLPQSLSHLIQVIICLYIYICLLCIYLYTCMFMHIHIRNLSPFMDVWVYLYVCVFMTDHWTIIRGLIPGGEYFYYYFIEAIGCLELFISSYKIYTIVKYSPSMVAHEIVLSLPSIVKSDMVFIFHMHIFPAISTRY